MHSIPLDLTTRARGRSLSVDTGSSGSDNPEAGSAQFPRVGPARAWIFTAPDRVACDLAKSVVMRCRFFLRTVFAARHRHVSIRWCPWHWPCHSTAMQRAVLAFCVLVFLQKHGARTFRSFFHLKNLLSTELSLSLSINALRDVSQRVPVVQLQLRAPGSASQASLIVDQRSDI